MLSALTSELRYAARTLGKSPGFTFISILTLALGIGANTAIFSAVNAVLLRPLPYPASERLVLIREKAPDIEAGSVSLPNYLDWCAAQRSFVSIALVRSGGVNALLGQNKEPRRLNGLRVTWNTLVVFGLHPQAGRDFSEKDDQPGAAPTAMISDKLWREAFGAAADVLGKRLTLNGIPTEIIGILPREMQFGREPQILFPLGDLRADKGTLERGNHDGFSGIGRLNRGVTLAQANSEFETIAKNLERQYPESNTGRRVTIRALLDSAVGKYRSNLYILVAAAACVLLIACGNVAGLVLARGTSRLSELAVRSALGASRRRLTIQLLVETLLLALIGGAVGILLAVWGLQVIVALSPADDLRFHQMTVNATALGFALGVATISGLVAGGLPAWWSAGAAVPALALRDGGRGGTDGAGRQRLRDFLIVGQVALALILLTAAGLFSRSLAQLQNVDLGFRPDNLLLVSTSLPPARYAKDEQIVRFYRDLAAKVKAMPQVEAVATGINLPFDSDESDSSFHITGRPPDPPGKEPLAEVSVVSRGYFHALGARIIRGREFGPEERPDSPKSVIIDDWFASHIFPNEDPIGQHIDDNQTSEKNAPPLTIVGVVARTRKYDPSGSFEKLKFPAMYFCTEQSAQPAQTILVRSSTLDPFALLPAIKAQIASIDLEQPVSHVTTMQQSIAENYSSRKLTTALASVFGILATILTAVGLFGVMALRIGLRTREMGIRLALGAQRGQIFRMVIGSGLRLTGAGILVGFVASLAMSRLLQGFLFGISSADPITFVAVTASLVLVAVTATYFPARRAAGLDPIASLHQQ